MNDFVLLKVQCNRISGGLQASNGIFEMGMSDSNDQVILIFGAFVRCKDLLLEKRKILYETKRVLKKIIGVRRYPLCGNLDESFAVWGLW